MHWRAQCHANWPRGSRRFQHPAAIEPEQPDSLRLTLTLSHGYVSVCRKKWYVTWHVSQPAATFLSAGLLLSDCSGWVSRPGTKYQNSWACEVAVLFDLNLSRCPFLRQVIDLDLLLWTGFNLEHAVLFQCHIFTQIPMNDRKIETCRGSNLDSNFNSAAWPMGCKGFICSEVPK